MGDEEVKKLRQQIQDLQASNKELEVKKNPVICSK
jgi:hypothetical protein